MSEVEVENFITLAKLAEQAERYDDMSDYMTQFVKQGNNNKLSQEQRNLLSVAFKNVVGAKRSSWRILSADEQKCTDETKKGILQGYCEKVVNELNDVCDKVLVSFTVHLRLDLFVGNQQGWTKAQLPLGVHPA